ncbi:WXG100 family type VII secretion target [Actinocrispum wychmicini]|uniref:ESAT-6-like protein n=1 Tax=Actinocrispum wychmicini TaxID=1213861 RepID=A0A4R2JXR3_9PSEU|nr:WXG100 family type VII secretion target [Actinocrispum wychmicini]TCO65381.1 WXG100 family type VII secretion target [Actinocrispum wychmicini]
MPEGYVVTGADLLKAKSDTQNVRDNSAANINNMRNQLAGIEGAWQGQAATAFHSLLERFNTASDRILQDLQTISENLGTAATQYGAREEESSQSLKNAGGGDFSF